MALAALLIWAGGQPAWAQSGAGDDMVSSPANSAAVQEAVKEIDDPAIGDRWLLVKDAGHPGGPGRLVKVSGMGDALEADATAKPVKEVRRKQSATVAMPGATAIVPPKKVIVHGGQRIVVEQNSPVLTARFEAVALEPAVKGQRIEARLGFNKRRVWVIVLGPGRAELAPMDERAQWSAQ